MHEVPDVDVEHLGDLEAQQDDVDDDDSGDGEHREGRCPTGAAQRREADLGHVIAAAELGVVVKRRLNGAQQEVDGKHHALKADAHQQTRTQCLRRLHAEEQTENEDDDGQHDGCTEVDEFLEEGKSDIHEISSPLRGDER